LDSDVVCSGRVGRALSIAASDVVLKMQGFTVRAAPGVTTGTAICVGCGTGAPVQRVRIKRGSIEGFNTGIALWGDDSTIYRISINSAFTGVAVFGHRNQVLENTTTNFSRFFIQGNDNYVWGNVITGIPASVTANQHRAVHVIGDGSRTVYNRIDCGGGGADSGSIGILVASHIEFTVVNRNTVSNCRANIVIAAPAGGGAGEARVALNQTTGGLDGIYVPSTRGNTGTVNRNTVREASEIGIYIGDGIHVAKNGAFDNGIGIEGEPGAIDGGGNVASGNRVDCINVSCSSP
jgi:hypothetical protein